MITGINDSKTLTKHISCNCTLWAKKTVPQIEFTVTFGLLKILTRFCMPIHPSISIRL